jgi:hypothetical protein
MSARLYGTRDEQLSLIREAAGLVLTSSGYDLPLGRAAVLDFARSLLKDAGKDADMLDGLEDVMPIVRDVHHCLCRDKGIDLADPRQSLWHRKVKIDFAGDLNAAIDFAKEHGGRIANELGVESPTVLWFSPSYTPTAIFDDLPKGCAFIVDTWNRFVNNWGGLVENPK